MTVFRRLTLAALYASVLLLSGCGATLEPGRPGHEPPNPCVDPVTHERACGQGAH